MNYSKTLTVTQVNTYIKALFEGDRHLSRVMVCGEISNFKSHYASGHLYFTLKDARAQLRVVMFRKHASLLRFVPQDGMAVVAGGEISVFERDGQYQLYCTDMMPEGIGALALAYEQRKESLAALGLFDEDKKVALPPFPKTVAVITSKSGAAFEDVKNVIARRCPSVRLLLCPVPVQGDAAAKMIVRAIRQVNALQAADVILLARGGGSYEDLFVFNDADIAYAIFESAIPVISAIGHETDFTIADFVSDVRAPTPSAGAELAVADAGAVLAGLDAGAARLRAVLENRLRHSLARVDDAQRVLRAHNPKIILEVREQRLKELSTRLGAAAAAVLSVREGRLAGAAALMDSLSPLRVLGRGYALVHGSGGGFVRSAAELTGGDRVVLRFADGEVPAEVTKPAVRSEKTKKGVNNHGKNDEKNS